MTPGRFPPGIATLTTSADDDPYSHAAVVVGVDPDSGQVFDGRSRVDCRHTAETRDAEKTVLDYSALNGDCGTIFHINSKSEAGIEMIQSGLLHTACSAENEESRTQLSGLENAEQCRMANRWFEFHESGELIQFNDKSKIPATEEEWLEFLRNNRLSEELLSEYSATFNNACWKEICVTCTLTEQFMQEHEMMLDWDSVAQFQKLSEEFILKFETRLADWSKLSLNQILSEKLIREMHDKVHWDYVCVRQKLSEQFLREFMTRINWHIVSWSQKLSPEFICEFADKMHFPSLLRCHKLPEDILRKLCEKFDANAWSSVALMQVLSDEFIADFESELDFDHLSMNPNLTDQQIGKYAEKLNWDRLITFGRVLGNEQIIRFSRQISELPELARHNWQQLLADRKRFPITDELSAQMTENGNRIPHNLPGISLSHHTMSTS